MLSFPQFKTQQLTEAVKHEYWLRMYSPGDEYDANSLLNHYVKFEQDKKYSSTFWFADTQSAKKALELLNSNGVKVSDKNF